MNADFQALLSPWNLRFERERPEIPLEGSPERALSRTVVEDDQRRLFILERLAPETKDRQAAIASALTLLHRNGLDTVNPYWPIGDGFLAFTDGEWWRLQPFLPSVKLDRRTYATETWRGEAMAGFLAGLARAAAPFPRAPHFPFPAYCRRIASRLEQEKPRAFRELADVWKHLHGGLFDRYNRLPMRFVHGDFHPLNILWTDGGIRAVIDWEFCGFKPELYDAALLAGCIGFDSPEYLTGPLLAAFFQHLRQAGFVQPASWRAFTDLVLAIRVGWLREWLVRRDKVALDQEVVYMTLLLDNAALLATRWDLP